MTIICRIVIL